MIKKLLINATNFEFENAIMFSKLGFFIYKRDFFLI